MIPVYRNVDSPNGDFGLTRQEGDEEFVVLTKAEYAALCPVTSPGAHGEGEAVNLWRNDWKHSPMPWVGVKWETCDRPAGSTEYRALPVDAYNALLARANTAKVAAELMRAERDALRALLKEATRHLRNHLVTARWCAEFEDTGATRTNIEREVAEAEAVLPRIDDALGEG